MGETLSPDRTDTAYQCGRLMAVYAAIQSKALGSELGAGVLERYYATASTSPMLVLGKLANLSQYHLSKLDRSLAVYFENILADISTHIEHGGIPATLTLPEQAEFALGYYHQRAALFTPRDKQQKEG